MPRLAVAYNKDLLLTPTPCSIHPNYSLTIQWLQKASNCPADTTGWRNHWTQQPINKRQSWGKLVFAYLLHFLRDNGKKSSAGRKEVLLCRSSLCLPILYLFQVLGRIPHHSQIQESLDFLGNAVSTHLMNSHCTQSTLDWGFWLRCFCFLRLAVVP